MTKEQLAEKLHNMNYRNNIPDSILTEAKENNLLIITGASDDLIEFEGVWEDEGSCYAGGTFLLGKEGLILKPDQDDYGDSEEEEDKYFADHKAYHKSKKSGRYVIAEWCKLDEYSWSYTTSIPHATFDVLEDGDKYCRGIVININDLN